MATIPQIRNRLLEGFPEPQADLLAHVFVESYDALVTKAELNELTGVVKELAVAQNRTEQRVGELAVAQNRTEVELTELTKTVDRLATIQEKMLIRLDRNDGRSFELFLRTHLPAYLGRHMRKCRVISADDLLDTVEGRLTDVEIDDLLRADLVATALVDGTQTHLVGEVSCTADNDDIVRAARRAGHLRKAGLAAMPFVACEAIAPKMAEFASRENVRVLIEGRLLPETDSP
ncbi:MAG: hypothetical protein WCJ18_09100 [Planctomycetota bacterium]